MSNEVEDSILSGMKAQRRLLDAAISAYEAFKGGGTVSPTEISGEFGERGGGSTDVPNGVFNGLTIPAAVKLYLKIVNKKQTTAEIVAGLKKGEMESTALNFHKLVRATLIRLWKVKRELILTGEYWALPEFFSPQVRASLSSEPIQSKKQPRSKKQAKKTPKKAPVQAKQANTPPAAPQQPASPAPGGATGTPSMRIEEFLGQHVGKEFTIQQVATATQIPDTVAGLLLGKLVGKKKAEKVAVGKYRAARADQQPMPVAS